MNNAFEFHPQNYQTSNSEYISPFPSEVSDIPSQVNAQIDAILEEKQSSIINTPTPTKNNTIDAHTNPIPDTNADAMGGAATNRNGATRLGTTWSKNINKLFGQTIPNHIPHVSIGKMFSNAIAAVNPWAQQPARVNNNNNNNTFPLNLPPHVATNGSSDGTTPTSLSANNHNEIEEYSDMKTEDVLALIKNDPPAAAKLSLSLDQWVALAKTDPEATGRLLFDQTHAKQDEDGEIEQKPLFKFNSKRGIDIGVALSDKLGPAQFSQVINGALSREINETGHETLLRGTSIGLQLYDKFEEKHLRPLLNRDDLKSTLASIPKEPFVTTDKNNMLMISEDKHETLKELVNQFSQIFAEILLANSDEMAAFRSIVSNIKTEANNKKDWSGLNIGSEVADPFPLLRLLNPIFSGPKSHGVEFEYDTGGGQQANGMLIGTIMQNLANGTIPRNSYLQPFYSKEISTAEKENIKNLLNKVSAEVVKADKEVI